LQLRDLEFLTTLIRVGSVTKAAELMNTTQSNASKILKKLEERFGFELVVRTNGRIVPTAEGQVIAERAQAIVMGLRQLDLQARNLRELRHGSLIVGSTPQLSRAFVPNVASQFMRVNPEVSISIETRNSQVLIDLVANRQLDFAVGLLSSEDTSIECVPLFDVHMLGALPKQHSLAGKSYLTAADFHQQDFITSSMLDRSREQIESFFSAGNAKPFDRGEASLSYARIHMVKSGLGITMIDSLAAKEYSDSDLVFLPLLPSIEMKVWLIKSRLSLKSMIHEAFEQNILEHAKNFAMEVN